MPGRSLVVVFAMLVTTGALAAERMPDPPVTSGNDVLSSSGWWGAGDTAPGLVIGDPAPEFSYLATDGRWHSWRELVDGGPTLLVFGARDPQLRELDGAS